MPETSLLTLPGAPRQARLSAQEAGASTSEFLDVAEMNSVIIRWSEISGIVDRTTIGDVLAESTSRVTDDAADRIASKRPKRIRLSVHGKERFTMLKKYEGVVISRDDDFFIVRLFENPSDYPVLEAEFGIDDIPESERELVVAGAPLVWTISYRHEGNTRSRYSTIYLRRTRWNAQDLNHARERLTSFLDGINWPESSPREG